MLKIKKFLITFIIFLLILFYFPHKVSAQEFNPDEVIVKYRRPLTLSERLEIHRGVTSQLTDRIESLNVDIVKTNNRVKEVVGRLKNDPRVEYVEPNYLTHAFMVTNDPGVTQNLQWGMYKIKAADEKESAWNFSVGSASVKVAILDTGIDSDHEDLKGKIVSSKNCSTSFTADDKYGHGTHVAGIVAASTNNAIGVAGVGFGVSLINAKALGDSGSGYYSWLADCLIWAADNGANVVNMSLGGASQSKLLEDAINYAYQKGVVLVAAAGNNGSSTPSYPAAYSNVLAVAAVDSTDVKASFSNWGSWVDVAAPGVNIYSTLPNHYNAFKKYNYGYLSGTSMATPHVAGLASLLFSTGNFSNSQVIDFIEKNTDVVSGTPSYWQYGRINAYKSLSATNTFSLSPTPNDINVPTSTPTPSPTPTSAPSPTVTPTVVPTLIPSSTPILTPTPSPANNYRSRFCIIIPSWCK